MLKHHTPSLKMNIFHTITLCFIAILLAACGQGEKAAPAFVDTLIISQPVTDSVIFLKSNIQSDATELNRSENTLVVGKLPHNLRSNENGSKVYVTLVGSQAIAEIDVANQKILRTFLTDKVPMEDENAQPIEGHANQQASLHSTCFDCHHSSTGAAKPPIVGSRPFGIVLTNDNQIIVANSVTSNINFISLENGKITKTINVESSGDAREPTELAIMDGLLYVTVRPVLPSTAASELRAYDLITDELLYRVDVGAAVADIKIDQVNKVIYVSNFESNTVEKFSIDLKLLQTYIVGNGPFGLDVSVNEIFVANYYNNSLSKITLYDDEVISNKLENNNQQYANPTHISRSKNENTLYLISGGTNGFLLIMDSETLAVKNKIKIDGLSFDLMVLE